MMTFGLACAALVTGLRAVGIARAISGHEPKQTVAQIAAKCPSCAWAALALVMVGFVATMTAVFG